MFNYRCFIVFRLNECKHLNINVDILTNNVNAPGLFLAVGTSLEFVLSVLLLQSDFSPTLGVGVMPPARYRFYCPKAKYLIFYETPMISNCGIQGNKTLAHINNILAGTKHYFRI